MRRLLLLLGCTGAAVLAGPSAWAQSASAQVFMGSTVVLTNGDTLRGPLTLRQDMDLLLITMPDQTVRTVPALAVRTFCARGELIRYDALPPSSREVFMGANVPVKRRWRDVQRGRPFLVYPWNHDRDNATRLAPAFFERLNGGPVILLRRQQLIQRSAPMTDPYLPSSLGSMGYRRSGSRYFYTDVKENYYLATPEGDIVPLKRPKHDLLAYFPNEAEVMERYARENNLSFTEPFHLAHLVDYANSLRLSAMK